MSATELHWLIFSPLRQGNAKHAATKEMLSKKIALCALFMAARALFDGLVQLLVRNCASAMP